MDKKSRDIVDRLVRYALEESRPEILRYMKDAAERALKENTAIVKHSGKLSESEKEVLLAAIKKRFPQVQDLELKEDESLIGGIEVVYKDYRYDGTIKGKLEELAGELVNK